MLIEESLAQRFQDQYQTLLGHVALTSGLLEKAGKDASGLQLMTMARNELAKKPALLAKAMASMEQAGEPLAQDMQQAIASLRVGHWVYLRDTSSYSVFLETGALAAAYGVKALSEPFKEFLGDSGAIIEAGLLVFHGQIICDDLISLGAWVGKEYRSEFNATLAEYRTQGLFFRDRLLPAPGRKPAASKSK